MSLRLGRVPACAWGLLAILAAVLVANSLYVLNIVDPNPLGPRTGLMDAFYQFPVPIGGLPQIDLTNGTVSQALGHRAMLDLIHLHWPWWNPYEGTGTPLVGEMQAAALWPFTLLTLISNGQLWEHIMLELIAGWSTFFLLRRMSIGAWAASAAGIAFALNGTFSWFSHATVNPVAFLPLMLIGLEMAWSASVAKRAGGWWLIPVAGAFSFYGGFPEVTFIDGLLAVVWFAWRCWTLRAELPVMRAFAVKAVAGAVVALMLIAPMAIPILDYLQHGLTYAHQEGVFANLEIPHYGLQQMLLPYLYGPIIAFGDPKGVVGTIWEAVGGYLSTSLLLFGLLGVFSRRPLVLRVLLVAWILVGLSRTFGEPPLIGDVFSVVPVMRQVAFFRYATSSIEFAVIVLAGFGLDDLVHKRVPLPRLAILTVAALAVVAFAALTAEPLVHQLGVNDHSDFSKGSVLWGAGIVVLGFLVALVRRPRVRAGLLTGVVALDVIPLFMVPTTSAVRDVHLDLAPVAYLHRHLGTSRFFTLGSIEPNYGSYFGLASVNSLDDPEPTLFNNYVVKRLDQKNNPGEFWGTWPWSKQQLLHNIAGYRAAGVAYVLTPPGEVLPAARGFSHVFSSPTTWIYRLSGSRPYFTVSGCGVNTLSRTTVKLNCRRSTSLVRLETSMPGWSAQVDGHDTPVHTVDGTFQSVKVGAGKHRVTFRFTPPWETFGFIAFLGGLVCLLVPAAAARFRARRVGV